MEYIYFNGDMVEIHGTILCYVKISGVNSVMTLGALEKAVKNGNVPLYKIEKSAKGNVTRYYVGTKPVERIKRIKKKSKRK